MYGDVGTGRGTVKRSCRVCRKRRTLLSLLYSLCRETLRCRRVRIYKLCAPQAIHPLVPFEQTRFDSFRRSRSRSRSVTRARISVSSSARSLDARYLYSRLAGTTNGFGASLSRRPPSRSRSAPESAARQAAGRKIERMLVPMV